MALLFLKKKFSGDVKWEWWLGGTPAVQYVWTCDLEAARASAVGVEARMLETNVATRCWELMCKDLINVDPRPDASAPRISQHEGPSRLSNIPSLTLPSEKRRSPFLGGTQHT